MTNDEQELEELFGKLGKSYKIRKKVAVDKVLKAIKIRYIGIVRSVPVSIAINWPAIHQALDEFILSGPHKENVREVTLMNVREYRDNTLKEIREYKEQHEEWLAVEPGP